MSEAVCTDLPFGGRRRVCADGRELLEMLGLGGQQYTDDGIRVLCHAPVRRDLVPRHADKILRLDRPSRILAALIQATGLEIMPPCAGCVRRNGPWSKCVLPSTDTARAFSGRSCANCFFNGHQQKCSLAVDEPVELRGRVHLVAPLPGGRNNDPLVFTPAVPGPDLGSLAGIVSKMGNVGIFERLVAYTRTERPDLERMYKEACADVDSLHRTARYVMEELHLAGQRKSELCLTLAIWRNWESTSAARQDGGPSAPQDVMNSTS